MKKTIEPFVYILASHKNGTLYVGVTSNLMQRIYQHRCGTFDGSAKDKGVKLLMWFEAHDIMDAAITREKRIKRWKRQWRKNLIEQDNPDWRDLAVDLGFDMEPSTRLKSKYSAGDGFLPSQE